MNPSKMNANRTARLAREAAPRVAFTSETGVPTLRERQEAAQRRRVALGPKWGDEECPCGDC